MNIRLGREGYIIVVETDEFKGGQIFRFVWNKLMGGLMLGFVLFVSVYCIIGVALGIFVKFQEIPKGKVGYSPESKKGDEKVVTSDPAPKT